MQVNVFGSGLKKRHIVCYISIMFGVKISSYDGYNLTAIKPDDRCNVTDAEWAAMQMEANHFNGYVLISGWIPVNLFAFFLRSLKLKTQIF